MTKRKIHLVGSMPPEITFPLGWILDHVDGAGDLTTLPVDFEQWWIVDYLRSLRQRQAFRSVRWGDYQRYDDVMVYRQAGPLLTADDVSLRRVEQIRTAVDAYAALGVSNPKPPLQICRAHPLDLAIFTFVGDPDAAHPVRTLNGARLALKHQRLYEDDLVGEVAIVDQLAASAEVDYVYQLEEPHVLYALHKVPKAARPALASWLARRTARVLELCPAGRTIVHLCYGRLGGQEVVRPQNMAPAVTYLNALAKECGRAGVDLPKAVHLPAAFGQEGAPIEGAYYEPLRELDHAWSKRMIAGVASPVDAADPLNALEIFEHHLGTRVYAVASRCGMGDYTTREAELTMEVSKRIADA